MIMVRITMNVLPEKQKEVMQTLLSMIETAGKEKGCLSSDIFSDIEGKTVFDLIEEWETREDLDRHIGSEDLVFCSGQRAFWPNLWKSKSIRSPIRKGWRPSVL